MNFFRNLSFIISLMGITAKYIQYNLYLTFYIVALQICNKPQKSMCLLQQAFKDDFMVCYNPSTLQLIQIVH